METLYNIAISTAEKLLPLGGFLGDKMKLFSEGRKHLFLDLEKKISPNDRYIWIHAASLGEFEQAVPVIERLRSEFSFFKILVTFFSPSGFEMKKSSNLADVVTYLPLDTRKNAKQFLDLVKPEWALFIKYEFWPNFLIELKKRKIKTLLVSGSFRKDQIFFKPYGKWMRKYLDSFDHFFVQNERSRNLLYTLHFKNVTVSGDTRFDRVSRQIEQDNTLEFIETFRGGHLCIVAGSTWPEDEDLLADFILENRELKFIIAPHAIKPKRIQQLKERLGDRVVLFSEKEGKELLKYNVFIIDIVGLLAKIYSYADIAYVGGAAGNTGLHNILEPATFGVPIIIGRNYEKYPEAKQLRKLAGLFSVSSSEEVTAIMTKLIQDQKFRKKTGLITEHFIQGNLGATKIILDYIHKGSQKSKISS